MHPANKGLLFICFLIASGLIPFCMFDVWKGLKSCPLFASNWQYSQVGGEGGDTLCRNWAACSRAIFVREMRIIRAMYLSTVGDSQAWAPCRIKTRYKIPMSLPTLQNSLPQVYVLYTISTNNGLSSHDGWINFDALEEIQLFCECVYALFVICIQPKAYMFRIPVSPVSCGFCIATKLHTWCSLSVDLEELEP